MIARRAPSRAPSRVRLGALVVAALTLAAGCGPTPGAGELRLATEHFRFRVGAEPRPPYARESIRYRIVVTDKETGQPVSNGEGRIFASTRDGAKTWDSLLPVREVGTYTATLEYITAGEWAAAVEFRRDSTQPLERIDWMQSVRAARPAAP